MSAQLIKMGVDGVLNLASAFADRNFAKARYKIRAAEIAANKAIQEATNKTKAAYGNFNRYKEATAKQLAARNYANVQSTMAQNLLTQKTNRNYVREQLGIQAAEEEGALTATMTSAGVFGNTADQLQEVSTLRAATQIARFERAGIMQDANDVAQMGAAAESFVNTQGLDYTDDQLSFIDEINIEQVPSLGSTLFKAAASTVSGNYQSIPNLFKSAKQASNSSGFNTEAIMSGIEMPKLDFLKL